MDCEKWYKHQPEAITEAKGATIHWDFAIQTNRKINCSKLDIVIKDYKIKTRFLVDMLLLTDNISIKKYNRISEYRDLEIKTEKM